MDGQVLDEQPDRLTDITILQLLREQDKNGQKHTNQLPTAGSGKVIGGAGIRLCFLLIESRTTSC